MPRRSAYFRATRRSWITRSPGIPKFALRLPNTTTDSHWPRGRIYQSHLLILFSLSFAIVALLQQLRYSSFAAVALLQYLCCSSSATVALPQWLCHSSILLTLVALLVLLYLYMAFWHVWGLQPWFAWYSYCSVVLRNWFINCFNLYLGFLLLYLPPRNAQQHSLMEIYSKYN